MRTQPTSALGKRARPPARSTGLPTGRVAKRASVLATPPAAPARPVARRGLADDDDDDDDDDDEALRRALQRHFETEFTPLQAAPGAGRAGSEDGGSGSDSDSDSDEADSACEAGTGSGQAGFEDLRSESEDEGESDGGDSGDGPEIEEVVVSIRTGRETAVGDKREMRRYMSSKVPTPDSSRRRPAAAAATDAATAGEDDESANLKNDVALQRLLRESNLLTEQAASGSIPTTTTTTTTTATRTPPSSSSSTSTATTATTLTGRSRHKALDVHALALGAAAAVLRERNVPMAKQKGILRKRAEREAARRRDAADAGIVLERVDRRSAPWLTAAQKTAGSGRRTRGLTAPGVGKMRGGTLALSKRDIREITADDRHGRDRSKAGRGNGRGNGKGKRGGKR